VCSKQTVGEDCEDSEGKGDVEVIALSRKSDRGENNTGNGSGNQQEETELDDGASTEL
jgi:hypothetical protein